MASEFGEKLLNLLTFKGFKTDYQLAGEAAAARGSGGILGYQKTELKFAPVVIDQKVGQSYEDQDDLVGNGECVTYVKTAGNINAPTKDWIGGDFVKDAKDLKPGTVIMTADKDGKYPTGKSPKHAAEFIGHIDGGFVVREQWAERKDPTTGKLIRKANNVKRRKIYYNDMKKAQDNGNVYRVVLVPSN